jgi:ssDNA-binding Zn-finger/Zn-ribbon topoisomerase 1
MPADEDLKLVGKCPDCGAAMSVRKSKRGKVYYSCVGYPDCKFMSWDIPTGDRCPECNEPLIKTGRGTVKCSGKDCKYRVNSEEKKKLPKQLIDDDSMDFPPYDDEPPVYDDYYGQEDDYV